MNIYIADAMEIYSIIPLSFFLFLFLSFPLCSCISLSISLFRLVCFMAQDYTLLPLKILPEFLVDTVEDYIVIKCLSCLTLPFCSFRRRGKLCPCINIVMSCSKLLMIIRFFFFIYFILNLILNSYAWLWANFLFFSWWQSFSWCLNYNLTKLCMVFHAGFSTFTVILSTKVYLSYVTELLLFRFWSLLVKLAQERPHRYLNIFMKLDIQNVERFTFSLIILSYHKQPAKTKKLKFVEILFHLLSCNYLLLNCLSHLRKYCVYCQMKTVQFTSHDATS